MYERRERVHSHLEEPPNSRIFIIAPKTLSEDDFRKPFEQFGHIEEIWVVRDKNTGDRKGVTYIKFAKTSEAAKAIEAMNQKSIGGGRPIKVMVAASRDQGSKRDNNEEETLRRLFVMVPKTLEDSELYDYFQQYGDIDYANIIRDKTTKESKGFAYVKYTKFSAAAKAFEECDRKFKPVFAQPKRPREEREMPVSFSSSRNGSSSSLMPPPDSYRDEGYTKLTVIANPLVNQDQMWKLFDIVPTLDYCHLQFDGDRLRPIRAICQIEYGSSQWAAYAKNKFDGFEYPTGYRLIVKPEFNKFSGRTSEKEATDLLKIAETIAQASSLIQAAGLSPEILRNKLGLGIVPKNNDYCNVRLPDPLPLSSIDAEMKARCFIVCNPSPLPNTALKDIFCRFGDLIDAYMLPNRNCGYVKYASEAAAREAIKTLHGAEAYGIRLKVLEAEERNDRKRQRLDDDDVRMD